MEGFYIDRDLSAGLWNPDIKTKKVLHPTYIYI